MRSTHSMSAHLGAARRSNGGDRAPWVERVTSRLVERSSGRVPAEVVRSVIIEEAAAYHDARIQEYVEMFVERTADHRLRMLAVVRARSSG